ncbi:22225_t:CDS:2 [Gigaspora rosea]|nr:22225_t:CDS:2 [Gigaspora rosea]
MELDLQPACAELNIGLCPWDALQKGILLYLIIAFFVILLNKANYSLNLLTIFLTGKYTKKSVDNLKNKNGRYPSILRLANNEKNWEIFEVIKIAAEAEFNWILQKPGVTSPIIGARTKDQIIENLKSLEFKLTPEQMARLDSIFQSKAIPFPNTMFPQIQNQWVVIKFKCPKIFNLLGI